MCLDAADPFVRHAIESNAALLANARRSIQLNQSLLHSLAFNHCCVFYVLFVVVSIIQSRPLMLLLDRCMYDRYYNDDRSTDYCAN